MILIRVEVRRIVAGAIAKGDTIVHAAPILAWSLGRRPEELARWALRQGGSVTVVERFPSAGGML